MSYVCTNCGSVVSNEQFNEYRDRQESNKGCGCFLFGLAICFCISIVLIPIAILLFILINKKENVSECPFCHSRNCLVPDDTPIGKKLLGDNYSKEEIAEKEKQFNIKPKTKWYKNPFFYIGLIFIFYFLFAIGILIIKGTG